MKVPLIKTPVIKDCKSCSYYSKGKCLFLTKIKPVSYDVIVDYQFTDAVECRNDPVLCGPEGKYFKSK
jgi:hypothetical protein